MNCGLGKFYSVKVHGGLFYSGKCDSRVIVLYGRYFDPHSSLQVPQTCTDSCIMA